MQRCFWNSEGEWSWEVQAVGRNNLYWRFSRISKLVAYCWELYASSLWGERWALTASLCTMSHIHHVFEQCKMLAIGDQNLFGNVSHASRCLIIWDISLKLVMKLAKLAVVIIFKDLRKLIILMPFFIIGIFQRVMRSVYLPLFSHENFLSLSLLLFFVWLPCSSMFHRKLVASPLLIKVDIIIL